MERGRPGAAAREQAEAQVEQEAPAEEVAGAGWEGHDLELALGATVSAPIAAQ